MNIEHTAFKQEFIINQNNTNTSTMHDRCLMYVCDVRRIAYIRVGIRYTYKAIINI